MWDWNQNLEELLFLLKKAPEKSRLQTMLWQLLPHLQQLRQKGVAYLSGSLTHMSLQSIQAKNLSKGVIVTVRRKKCVCTDFHLLSSYGCSVPVVTAKVQERVKSAIENMTGLEVTEVKITVAGVNM
mgnify:CR=1 FL=1